MEATPSRGLGIAGTGLEELWCSQGQAGLGLSAASHRCLLCARYLLGKSNRSSTVTACPRLLWGRTQAGMGGDQGLWQARRREGASSEDMR